MQIKSCKEMQQNEIIFSFILWLGVEDEWQKKRRIGGSYFCKKKNVVD
jgi:hypothetical protein